MHLFIVIFRARGMLFLPFLFKLCAFSIEVLSVVVQEY